MKLKAPLFALFCGIGLMSFVPVWAGYQYYSAELDMAKWQSSGNRLECRLSQQIPGYGEALFRHRALQALEFRVIPAYTPRKPDQAVVFINKPSWKRFTNNKVLGRVAVASSKVAISMPEDWAFRLSLSLREGMEAAWSHADWGDGKDLVTASVLPINFEPAWRDFIACSQNLIDYGYNDVRAYTFYFNKKSMHLGRKEREKLDKLAEYVSLDPDYQFIRIVSTTDSRGMRRINLAVSRNRANMIKNYLVKKGVNPKRFVILARGEKKPKYNNRTRTGRAKNRRVEITLVK